MQTFFIMIGIFLWTSFWCITLSVLLMRGKIRFFLLFFVLLWFGVVHSFEPVIDVIKDIKVFKEKTGLYHDDSMWIAFKVSLKKGWHVYYVDPGADYLIPTKLVIKNIPKGFKIDKVIYSKKYKLLKTEYESKPLKVYENSFFIFVRVLTSKAIKKGKYTILFNLKYQACNDEQCLPPSVKEILVDIDILDLETPVNRLNESIFNELKNIEGSSHKESLFDKSIFIVLLLLFIGGLALNLTPCVYPMIPLTIGFFSAYKRGSPIFLALLYLLGITITYTIIGMISALSGSMLGSLLQNPYVILFIAIFFFVFSLQMLGIKSFMIFEKYRNIGAKQQSQIGPVGAFFRGLLLGIVGAPCIGPFTLSLILYIQKTQDVLLGGLYFFVLSLGLGTPYFLLAIFTDAIKKLPKSGNWMSAFDKVFALIMWVLAVYYLSPIIPKRLFPYVILLVTFVWFILSLFLEKKQVGKLEKKNIIILLVALFISSGYGVQQYLSLKERHPLTGWTHIEDKFDFKRLNNEKAIIYFTAEWCKSCHELKGETLSSSKVKDFLKENGFYLYVVDITKSPVGIKKRLVDRFNVKGCPTIVCMKNGKYKIFTGFMDKDDFINEIKRCMEGL